MTHQENGSSFLPNHENIIFHDSFRRAVRGRFEEMPEISVLDFGAGTKPSPSIPTRGFHRRERHISYDPYADLSLYTPSPELPWPTTWTTELPTGTFDLVVCHYSLHHVEAPLAQTIAGLKTYKPQILLIVDYDFNGSTQEHFAAQFVAGQERKELASLFGGDIEACHAYHTRLQAQDYQEALLANGATIVQSGNGEGCAQNKFFLIAQFQEPLIATF